MNSEYCQVEWAAAYNYDPTGKDRKLIPVRVDNVKPEGLLSSIIYIDLYKCKKEIAKKKLLNGIDENEIIRRKAKYPYDNKNKYEHSLNFFNLKKVREILNLIKKNKEWLFSGIGITIISLFFTVYNNIKSTSTDTNSVLNDKNNIEVNGNVDNDFEEDIEKKDEQKMIISPLKYEKELQDNVDGDIIFNYYDDFDGNGTYEMFAIVGDAITSTKVYEEEKLCGEIWFVNEDVIWEVESNELEYKGSPYIISIENNIFIAFERSYDSGNQIYVYGVRDGLPYQPNISGNIYGLKINEYDEIETLHYEIDDVYDKSLDLMIGQSYKKYYFYFDNGIFKEYGGININTEDIIKFPEINEIVNEIYEHLYVIDSIYYRDNNVININISQESDDEIRYYSITLRYINDKWSIVSSDIGEEDYGFGYYLRASMPTVATYPYEFPY